MRNHVVHKLICVVMCIIIYEIKIKITHTKNKFVFLGYFGHNLVNIFVKFFNFSVRMSV